jgi:predicted transcriptional regulator
MQLVGWRTAVRKDKEEGNDLQKIVDVAESIKRNLIKAIAAEQVVRPAASDDALIGCFNLGYATNAFELVRHSLLFDQIMALMRIWDTTANVHSMNELVRLFRNGDLVDKLVERERRASHDIIRAETTLGERTQEVPFSADHATPELREQQLRARLRAWFADVNKVRGYTEAARIRHYRNKILAHSAAWSGEQRVGLANYGDERKLLELTIPIVSEGYRLATGIDHDFSKAASIWELAQHDMWGIVRSAAHGKRYSPAPRTIDDLARELDGGGRMTIKG